MASSIITLLTDFGETDGFVGTMKGVIYGVNPEARIVDISHDIEPQDISSGAFVLRNSYQFFPADTIHVVVIDPGVGSERRILCVAANKHYFIAPDNGVLKYIYDECSNVYAVKVSNKRYFLPSVSRTFHGRDIFAPVAAHIATGLKIDELGTEVTDYERGDIPKLEETSESIAGEIVYIDRFGNLISNIPFNRLRRESGDIRRILFKGRILDHLCHSYSDGRRNEPIALVGSSGFLEIACNLANAKEKLNGKIGEKISVIFEV